MRNKKYNGGLITSFVMLLYITYRGENIIVSDNLKGSIKSLDYLKETVSGIPLQQLR